MKTIYGELCDDLGVVVLTDDILKRIAELRSLLEKSSADLHKRDLWSEKISAELTYGKDYQEHLTEEGPVLIYGDDAQQEKHKRINTLVYITVGVKGTTIHTYGCESSVSLINYKDTVESIPDVYFSEDFVRNYANYVVNPVDSFCSTSVKDVYDDMPDGHKKLLEEPTQKYIEYYELRKSDEELKKALKEDDRQRRHRKTVHDVMQKKGYAIKVGFDFHGVIDASPWCFSDLSRQIQEAGGEVHVLTGTKDTEELRKALTSYGIAYTHVFSILSYHESVGTKTWQDERGTWMDKETWDKSKAEYCKRMGIQVHIDDSDTYGKYFDHETTYVYYNTKTDKNEP